jgi:hypothetical protein
MVGITKGYILDNEDIHVEGLKKVPENLSIDNWNPA